MIASVMDWFTFSIPVASVANVKTIAPPVIRRLSSVWYHRRFPDAGLSSFEIIDNIVLTKTKLGGDESGSPATFLPGEATDPFSKFLNS